jgi:Iap family predicted aminopeptidase
MMPESNKNVKLILTNSLTKKYYYSHIAVDHMSGTGCIGRWDIGTRDRVIGIPQRGHVAAQSDMRSDAFDSGVCGH